MIFGVIVLGIIAYYLFNSSKSGGPYCMNHQPHAKDALDLLNERYAHGEMDRRTTLNENKSYRDKSSQYPLERDSRAISLVIEANSERFI